MHPWSHIELVLYVYVYEYELIELHTFRSHFNVPCLSLQKQF